MNVTCNQELGIERREGGAQGKSTGVRASEGPEFARIFSCSSREHEGPFTTTNALRPRISLDARDQI